MNNIQKWEYREFAIDISSVFECKELNALGKDGWEFVKKKEMDHRIDTRYIAIFKRQIKDSTNDQ